MTDILDTTEGCRFCLMCRHVCPVTRVTFNEATSPHGWALLISAERRGQVTWDAESTALLYACADCGLCQAHCATGQPLPEAITAARAQLADSSAVPPEVAALKTALQQWGNPYGPVGETPEPVERPTLALLVGDLAWHRERAELEAAIQLLETLGERPALISVGRSSGYLPYTVGLQLTAHGLAAQTAEEIAASGCRTVVTLSAEQQHTLTQLYPQFGAALPAAVTVVELTALLAQAHADGALRLRGGAAPLAYLDPEHTARLPERAAAPRQLVAAATGTPLAEGFWRGARAPGAGASGGLPWVRPDIARALAQAAVTDVTRSGKLPIVTESPETLDHLRRNAPEGTRIQGLYSLLAGQIQAER